MTKKPLLDLPDYSLISREDAEADVLFLSIGEGAIVTDAYGNISRVNKAALDILGFESGDMIGKWYPDTVTAEDDSGKVIPNIDRPITTAILTGKPVFRKIYYRKKDGSRIPVALTVSPVIFKQRPIGAIQVFRDITEEVELEKAKDEFISIASHQLRTPATIVKQYLGMMLEGFAGTLPKKQLEIVRTAYENNEHQLAIINDLLRVAQADANKIQLTKEKVDVVKLVKEVIQEQRAGYEQHRLSLVLKHTQASILCSIDPVHIRMVVENLLDNAKKYSPDGKKVIIELVATPKYVTIKVIDQGVGIAPKDLPKLFQKFSRIDNPLSFVGGTGLGLYWIKKLMNLHKGTVNVASTLHKGTTFTLKLPLGK